MKKEFPLDSGFWMLDASSRSGFTLIELLVALGIFSIAIVSFVTMLVAVTRVQVQQSSAAEVNEQSQFVLQEVQYYVENSSLVDMPTDTATTTLTLRMPSSTADPTVISISSGTLYLQQAGGALQPLTSSRVTLSALTFTRHANPPGHDSVDVSFTIAYNTSNIEQAFAQMLQTSVARVSAATFDSSIVPSGSGESVGVSGQTWTSINNLIDFSGPYVGVGVTSPQETLEVNGGLRINPQTSPSLPGCNSNSRGTLWYELNAPTSNDSLQLCVYTTSTSTPYQWVRIY